MKTTHISIPIRKFEAVIILLLFFPFNFLGQVELKNAEPNGSVRSIPQEKVFVHYNSSFLLTGENLFYKFYLLNSQAIEKAPISKIGYVEIQGKDGKSILRQKIQLGSGTGEGNFFIPTTVPSGNYKMIGYTRWMLNGDVNNIFEGDLVIVNPYLNLGNNLQVKIDENPIEDDTPFTNDFSREDGVIPSGEIGEYGKRQLVTINREDLPGMESGGSYSISVRRKLGIEIPKMANPESIINSGTDALTLRSKTSIFLPELRGELITGRIVPKNGSGGVLLEDRKIALSIPGENFVLKITRTNEGGEFLFIVETNNTQGNVLLQVLGKEKTYFDIKLDAVPRAEATSFPKFKIGPEMEKTIVEESVFNQIENGYFTPKSDTLQEINHSLPFYGDLLLTYTLDDYTRFNTVKEVLVEIVRDIYIRSNDKGEYLKTRGENLLVDSNMSSLLLVDGVLVQDHEQLINYPAKKIYSIGLLREKYFYGTEVYHGIIHVRTIEGDFFEGLSTNYVTTSEILRPQQKKKYFQQTYEKGGKASRIPDFRRQLLWEPNLNLNKKSIDFYTSDVTGVYEIVIQGFDSSGKPLTIRKTFTVK